MKQLDRFFYGCDKDKTYIIGVSGGADSMALLDMARQYGLNLVVCHINYKKREDTSIDYQIVSQYCKNYHIAFEYKEVHTYHKGNFQNQARIIRYDFFAEIGLKYQTNQIMVAHHKDDVIETILMQQERKAITQTTGIKRISQYKDMEVIRPLLSLEKKDLMDWCEKNHIEYHHDYTNFDNRYTRNKIRHQQVALLSSQEKEEMINQANKKNIELEKQRKQTQENIKKIMINHRINRQKLLMLSKEEIIRLIYMYLSSHQEIKKEKLSMRKLDTIYDFIVSDHNASLQIQKNYYIKKEYDYIFIEEKTDEIEYIYTFNDIKEFHCEYFHIKMEGHIHQGVYLSKEEFPITIRNYRQGDQIALSIGHKKINRLFIDKKIPKNQREKWPIVLNSSNKIVLVPGIAKNKDYLMAIPNVYVVQ